MLATMLATVLATILASDRLRLRVHCRDGLQCWRMLELQEGEDRYTMLASLNVWEDDTRRCWGVLDTCPTLVSSFLGHQTDLVSRSCRPRTGIQIRDLTMLANISLRADMAKFDNVGACLTVNTIAFTLPVLR